MCISGLSQLDGHMELEALAATPSVLQFTESGKVDSRQDQRILQSQAEHVQRLEVLGQRASRRIL